MTNQKNDVTIVGGGVIGLSCAYFLQKEGFKVRIIDKDKPGDSTGTSYGNAGMIVPSHFIPLAAPGIIVQGMKWILDSKSPLYIKPRASWTLIDWLIKFAQSSTNSHVLKSAPVLRDLNLLSKKLYQQIEREASIDFGLKHKGIVMMSKSQKDLDEEIEVGEKGRKLGLEMEILDAAGIKQLEPEVEVMVLGGVHYPLDSHLIPAQFVSSMSGLLERRGVIIEKNTEVLDFQIEGSKVKGIITNNGESETDNVVIASGTWTGALSKKMKLNIPMQAGKGYSFAIDHTHIPLTTPSILTEARIAVTPMGDKLRFGGTMEITGLDTSINRKRVQAIIDNIPAYYPAFKPEWMNMEEVWRGLRPLSPDGLPYIGRSSKISNVVLASGHATVGLSLAPVTGRLVSDILNEVKPEIDIDLLDPERFA